MIVELMRRRRTVRAFRPDQVPDEVLRRLVEAAGLAPSAANKQPWRFLVVRDPGTIEAAARETEAELALLQAQVAEEFQGELTAYSRQFVSLRGAPALVVPIFRPLPGMSLLLAQPPDPALVVRMRDLESHAALVSVAMAIQNMLLVAEELGIGACCATAPLVAANRLAALLDVPEGWQIAALVAVGYPAEEPQDPGRKPVSLILKWK